jgi:hypothetical protein
MKKYDLIVVIISLMSLVGAAQAQYWFQSGANGGVNSQNNNGGGVSIQTISPQQETIGSLAYWVGETLSNGAFVQMGYEVPNQTGYAPQNCTPSGCSNTTLYQQGVPAWFWEYFTTNGNQNTFYGEIGPSGSAGLNGTFHNYSFNSSGDVWNFWFDGQNIGSINLGTSSSGSNPLLSIAEYADTNSNNYLMPDIIFKNMQVYNGRYYVPVSQAYSFVNYGKGSEESLPNPYGVKEIDNLINDFMAGSGLPVASQSLLWSQGFKLNIVSNYGVNGTEDYLAYTQVKLSMPMIINITSSKREKFAGWQGTGSGSYTGPLNTTSVYLGSNITERALWITQYYVNATSQYGIVSGGGWSDANSNVSVSLNSNIIGIASGERAVLSGWSNGDKQKNVTVFVYGPITINADWTIQYLVNATTAYGSITGDGWYNANSTDTISPTVLTLNAAPQQRIEFEGWSDGVNQSTRQITITGPVFISAVYAKQYFVTLSSEDAYSRAINASYFSIDGNNVTTGFFAFQNRVYTVSSVYYKNVQLLSNKVIANVAYPQTVQIQLPVYNVTVQAVGIFDIPLNASLNITFKNNTHVATYLGSQGKLVIPDVPYGYAYGYDNFLGERQGVSLSNGGIAQSSFVTPSIVGAIFVALILIFLIEVLYFREKERPVHILKQANANKQSKKSKKW